MSSYDHLLLLSLCAPFFQREKPPTLSDFSWVTLLFHTFCKFDVFIGSSYWLLHLSSFSFNFCKLVWYLDFVASMVSFWYSWLLCLSLLPADCVCNCIFAGRFWRLSWWQDCKNGYYEKKEAKSANPLKRWELLKIGYWCIIMQ